MENPLIGVLLHWLGGLSSASFYVPYQRIKQWSWEIFWLTGGLFSWLVFPWLFAAIQTNDLLGVLSSTPSTTLLWCYAWGAGWGLGGLTFGLTLRYLGLSLGMAIALGLTTVLGTLGPPIFDGSLAVLVATVSGKVTLLGIAVAVVGIAIVARAGALKDQELSLTSVEKSISEFNLKKGVVVAVFSGVMSSCFVFGLAAGEPIRHLTLAAGTSSLWQGLPVLCVVLAGGLTTNTIWCVGLIIKNGSVGQWLGRFDLSANDISSREKVSLPVNYSLAALGGALWYFQFFFYTVGESQMGAYGFSSWTLHMASIILFSTLWGFALKEWADVSTNTRRFVWLGISVLVLSTIIIGLGNMLLAE